MFLPHPRLKVSIVESLRDREVACSASDRQGSNFESCVWRTVSSQSSHHPQKVLLAQFSLYVHKGSLKPDSFHFIYMVRCLNYFRLFYSGINPHNAELFLYKQWRPRFFFQFEVIINVLVSSFQYVNCFSARTVFIRHNLTSTDVRL